MFLSHPNPESRYVIYSLRTSHWTIEEFLSLFKEHGIEIGVDIWSFPTSRYPHFIKESLKKSFESEGIQYLHLGKELGRFRKEGYLTYMESHFFKEGLRNLEEIGRKKRTAFFCSERFPWKCHRRWVATELVKRGWQVIHIIEKGRVWIPKKLTL